MRSIFIFCLLSTSRIFVLVIIGWWLTHTIDESMWQGNNNNEQTTHLTLNASFKFNINIWLYNTLPTNFGNRLVPILKIQRRHTKKKTKEPEIETKSENYTKSGRHTTYTFTWSQTGYSNDLQKICSVLNILYYFFFVLTFEFNSMVFENPFSQNYMAVCNNTFHNINSPINIAVIYTLQYFFSRANYYVTINFVLSIMVLHQYLIIIQSQRHVFGSFNRL